jgi:ATP-dependent Clp protease adapter protein ClpS
MRMHYLGKCVCIIWGNAYALSGEMRMHYLGKCVCIIWGNAYALFSFVYISAIDVNGRYRSASARVILGKSVGE